MSTLIKRLEKHTADNLVLWVKFHNLHWHVRGRQFKAVHEMTEGYYDELAEDHDAFAERLVQLGVKAPASVKQYLNMSSVPELDAKDFTVEEVLNSVKKDFEYLLAEYKESRILAAESGDTSSEALLVDCIARLEKQIWMLSASLA